MKQPLRKREDGEILGFYLAGDLPEGQALVLNTRLGTFAHLGTTAERRPALLREEQMTDTEQRLLRPLLEHHPDYCPHEVLFIADGFSGSPGGSGHRAEPASLRRHSGKKERKGGGAKCREGKMGRKNGDQHVSDGYRSCYPYDSSALWYLCSSRTRGLVEEEGAFCASSRLFGFLVVSRCFLQKPDLPQR